jgi:cytochrome c
VDSFEWNKIAGGVLAAFLLIMVANTFAERPFEHERQEKPAYVPEGCADDRTCGAGSAATPGPVEKAEPLANLLIAAAATPEKGLAVFKQCTSCHNNAKGGAAGTGPNLWGIVGNSHAHSAGFPYSAALAGMKGKPWTWEAMDAWIANPKTAMPGNKMSFGGLSNASKRAQLLVYLNSQSDKPLPLPAAVKVEAAAAPVAPAAADAGKKVEAAAVPAAPAIAAK